jgi:hypothetical protein
MMFVVLNVIFVLVFSNIFVICSFLCPKYIYIIHFVLGCLFGSDVGLLYSSFLLFRYEFIYFVPILL